MSAKAASTEPPNFASELRERFGEQSSTHQPLAEYFSSGLGGTAEYLVVVSDVTELIDAVRLATRFHLPVAIVGGGSGILVSDVGFPGLVVMNRSQRIIDDRQKSQIVVDSGVMTDRLVNVAAAQGLGGLEFLAAIPGTIGGAVATAAGYDGKSILGAIKELILFVPDGAAGQVVSVGGSEITTGPFERLFPNSIIESPVILSVRLQFSQIDQREILRRLQVIRQARAKLLVGPQLGRIFVQEAAPESFDKNLVRAWRKVGVDINPVTGIITRLKDRANAVVLRRVMNELKHHLAEQGHKLEERLDFLGYWPDEEAPQTTADNLANPPDAESL